MEKNRHAWWVILPFFGILLLFFCLSFVSPDHNYSVEESRRLPQKPVWDFSNVSALTENWTVYVVDQFPLRSKFLKMYSSLELLQDKYFTRNTYVTPSGWLMTPIYKVTSHQCDNLTQAVSSAAERVSMPFVYAVLPQKNDMLHELGNPFIDNSCSDANKSLLLEKLSNIDGILTLDVGKHFIESYTLNERMGMYYKTDFHWNDLGAFRAAQFICSSMKDSGFSVQPALSSDFTWHELHTEKLYQGDLNRRFSNLFSMREEIPYYEYVGKDFLRYYSTASAEEPVARNTIVATGLNDDSVNYNTISTANLGYYRVVNPAAKTDDCLLILKDSFQNPTIDYFSAVYREVNVVDPRYYTEKFSFDQLAEERNVDIVLFMYHQNNISEDLIAFLNAR